VTVGRAAKAVATAGPAAMAVADVTAARAGMAAEIVADAAAKAAATVAPAVTAAIVDLVPSARAMMAPRPNSLPRS
jgi:hypothetical protein